MAGLQEVFEERGGAFSGATAAALAAMREAPCAAAPRSLEARALRFAAPRFAPQVARVLAHADELFQKPEHSEQWLRGRILALGGKRPMDLFDTEEGIEEVDHILGRIEHGIIS